MSQAHNIGDVALLEPGVYVQYDRGGVEYQDENTTGGLMIGREERVDSETGEISAFIDVVDLHRGRIQFHKIPLDKVCKEFDPPYSPAVCRVARAIARDLGDRKGMVDTQEMRLVETLSLLYRVVFGG